MKLYINQKVFSWGDKFAVKNEYGEDIYFVKGEVFSLAKSFMYMTITTGNLP